MVALWWMACASLPEVVSGPSLGSTEAAPLARLLSVSSDRPTRLSVRAMADDQGFEVAWPSLATRHEVPLLGLKPDRTWTVEVFLDERLAGTLEVVTPPLPADFATVEVLAWEPDVVEPGYRLATVRRVTASGAHDLVVYDMADLEVAWFGRASPNFGDVRKTEAGTLLGVREGEAVEADFLLRTLTRWTPEPTADVDVRLPSNGVHHELYPLPDDTFLTLSWYTHRSAAYPSSVDDPEVRDRAADLQASRVVRFGRDGTLVSAWPLGDVFDDGRISMSSLEEAPAGDDWLHTNAVIPAHDGQGVIVSVRHQDALVKLDENGEIVWILGDPAGWREPWASRLLQPVGEVRWPYHPHAPAWSDDGQLVVFDNHNFGHTPYGPAPQEPWASRVVAYAIDEDAGTVEERWSFAPEDSVQSPRMGDADPLPLTGHVLANFGWIEEGPFDEDGRPASVSMRLVEVDPANGSTPLDLRLTAPDDGGPPGVRSYRAESIGSLYPDDVRFERISR